MIILLRLKNGTSGLPSSFSSPTLTLALPSLSPSRSEGLAFLLLLSSFTQRRHQLPPRPAHLAAPPGSSRPSSLQ